MTIDYDCNLVFSVYEGADIYKSTLHGSLFPRAHFAVPTCQFVQKKFFLHHKDQQDQVSRNIYIHY